MKKQPIVLVFLILSYAYTFQAQNIKGGHAGKAKSDFSVLFNRSAEDQKNVRDIKLLMPYQPGQAEYLPQPTTPVTYQYPIPVQASVFEPQPAYISNQSPIRGSGKIEIHAVVVGVSNCFAMDRLSFADDDAIKFADHLKSFAGGAVPAQNIKVLTNGMATQKNIQVALQNIANTADDNDVIIFFFSGHGLNGAFVPVDFDGFNNQLLHRDIIKILDGSRARQKLCIADACFSGTLSNSFVAKGVGKAQLSNYYDAFAVARKGTAMLMSSNPAQNSLEDQALRQGVFTHYLLLGMKGAADYNRNRIITIDELYRYLRSQVITYTGGLQTPVLYGDCDGNMPVANTIRN